jgi:hypothetical protein
MASILLTVTAWHLISAANSYQNDWNNDAIDHGPAVAIDQYDGMKLG